MVRPGQKVEDRNDAGVWARMCAGDERALEELFTLYYMRLCDYAVRMVGERDLAETVVIGVMTAVWNRRDALQSTASPRGYLYGAVRLRAIDVMRAQRIEWAWEDRAGREPGVAIGMGNSVHPPDMAMSEAEIDQAISHGIGLLPPRCRAVFELRWYGQMSYMEISTALDISVKTVEAQVGKAFRMLRTLLKPLLDGESVARNKI